VALLAVWLPQAHFLTLDAATFLASATAIGLIGRLRPLPRVAPDAAESFGAAIARGFRAMRAHALLGYVLGSTFVINGAWYAVMFLGLPLAIEHFGVRGPGGTGLGAYGLVVSAYGCTNLLATVVVGSRTLPARPGMLMFSGTVTVGAGILLLGAVMALPVPPAAQLVCLMAAAGIAGIGGPMSDITIATLRQTLLATADMAAAMRAYMVMTNLGVLARGIAFGISLTVSPSRHRPSAIWASPKCDLGGRLNRQDRQDAKAQVAQPGTSLSRSPLFLAPWRLGVLAVHSGAAPQTTRRCEFQMRLPWGAGGNAHGTGRVPQCRDCRDGGAMRHGDSADRYDGDAAPRRHPRSPGMTTGPVRVAQDRDAAVKLADPATAGDVAACERSLFDVFAELAARHPEHLAVDDGTARLSYAKLRDRALALGARIAAVVPMDGLVGVLVPTGVFYPVAWLACLAARRPFLPLDPHVPPARTQAIIAEAGLAAVIVPTTATDFSARLPAGLARIPMEGELEPEPAPLPEGLPPAKVGMVLFTSGSTGRAKGIALHERSQLRKAMNYRAACGLGPGDRLLSLHPPSTNGGAGDTLGALLCGATLHVADLKRAGLAGVQTVLRGGITVCATVPVVMRTLMAMDGAAEALRHVRVLRLGGDTVMGSDVAGLARVLAPAARILVRFGMTESGATLAQRLVDPRAPVESGPLALDTAVPGQMISAEDAAGKRVAPGEVGELVIRGRCVALGHWVGGQLDTSAFPADPSAPGARCYRTGDMVLLRADGMLVPVGRTDRQVKINGTRVEPNETEAALRGLSDVMDAAVLAHGDTSAPTLVAFVVPAAKEHATEPSAQTAAQLARGWRATLAALLPPQQVPAHIHVLPAIPLLPSLKPDLGALRALLARENAPGVLGRVWSRLRGSGARGPAARIQPAALDDSAP
jgi:non-ribosomal peptide synthetase component F